MSNTTNIIEVGIYLHGVDLDPDELSNTLGLQPSKSSSRGDIKITSRNKSIVAKQGLWALVENFEFSSMDDAIHKFLLKIGGAMTRFKNMPGVEEAYFDVFLATDAEDEGGGTCSFQISNTNISALNQLGLSVRITAAVVSDGQS